LDDDQQMKVRRQKWLGRTTTAAGQAARTVEAFTLTPVMRCTPEAPGKEKQRRCIPLRERGNWDWEAGTGMKALLGRWHYCDGTTGTMGLGGGTETGRWTTRRNNKAIWLRGQYRDMGYKRRSGTGQDL
jgi:hypothetical protein